MLDELHITQSEHPSCELKHPALLVLFEMQMLHRSLDFLELLLVVHPLNVDALATRGIPVGLGIVQLEHARLGVGAAQLVENMVVALVFLLAHNP